MGSGDPFNDRDLAYLRQVQYADSSRLSARASLHVQAGTADMAWFPWVAGQVKWPRRARVLEVGCGTGWLWAEAAAHLPDDLDLTLTDLSEHMVGETLGRVAGRGRHHRVVGAVMDAQAIPLGGRSFDVVIANHMLYHVPDPEHAVCELVQQMKSDGQLVVATNGKRHLREMFDARDEVFGPLESTIVDHFGIEIAESILQAHLDEVTWLAYEDRLVCHDPADVVAFLASFPPVDGASPELLEQLGKAIQARFDEGGGVMEVSKETGLFVCRGPKS